MLVYIERGLNSLIYWYFKLYVIQDIGFIINTIFKWLFQRLIRLKYCISFTYSKSEIKGMFQMPCRIVCIPNTFIILPPSNSFFVMSLRWKIRIQDKVFLLQGKSVCIPGKKMLFHFDFLHLYSQWFIKNASSLYERKYFIGIIKFWNDNVELHSHINWERIIDVEGDADDGVNFPYYLFHSSFFISSAK